MIKIIMQLLLNASPVIAAAIFHMIIVKMDCCKLLSYPLDHNYTFRGKRIFGKNKTYRGVVIMILASIFFSFLYLYGVRNSVYMEEYNLLDFENYSFIFYGVLFGLGYVIGELPNSFMKRQMDIEVGKASNIFMIILDQIDSVLVIMFLLVFFSSFTWRLFFYGVFFYGFIHIIINYMLFLLGLRREAF